jgi:hypothetical protein
MKKQNLSSKKITTAQLASVLDITPSGVRKLWAQRILPGEKLANGALRFVFGDAVQSYADHCAEKRKRRAFVADPRVAELKRRKLAAEATLLEFKNCLMTGKKAWGHKVVEAIFSRHTGVTASLRNLSARICRVVAGKADPTETEAIIRKEISQATACMTPIQPHELRDFNETIAEEFGEVGDPSKRRKQQHRETPIRVGTNR